MYGPSFFRILWVSYGGEYHLQSRLCARCIILVLCRRCFPARDAGRGACHFGRISPTRTPSPLSHPPLAQNLELFDRRIQTVLVHLAVVEVHCNGPLSHVEMVDANDYPTTMRRMDDSTAFGQATGNTRPAGGRPYRFELFKSIKKRFQKILDLRLMTGVVECSPKIRLSSPAVTKNAYNCSSLCRNVGDSLHAHAKDAT